MKCSNFPVNNLINAVIALAQEKRELPPIMKRKNPFSENAIQRHNSTNAKQYLDLKHDITARKVAKNVRYQTSSIRIRPSHYLNALEHYAPPLLANLSSQT